MPVVSALLSTRPSGEPNNLSGRCCMRWCNTVPALSASLKSAAPRSLSTRPDRELFGFDSDQDVKRSNVLDFYAESERARGQNEIIPALLRQGHLEFETVGRNFKTGKEFPIQCIGFVIPDAKTGAPAFIACVAQDITERKRSGGRIKSTGRLLDRRTEH